MDARNQKESLGASEDKWQRVLAGGGRESMF